MAVEKVDEAGDQRRQRRALKEDEIHRLLAAVPPEYRLLYQFALCTGLRRNELHELLWGDLHLTDATPFIQLRAKTTKARRADALPLRGDLAQALRDARGTAADSDHVFSRVPRMKEHRRWLAAAGIPYLDHEGRRADIHALRHTYGTMLSKSGVGPREAMELMRHTDLRLTMKTYTDSRVFDLSKAVEKLPAISAELPKPATAQTVTQSQLDEQENRVAKRVARDVIYCPYSPGAFGKSFRLSFPQVLGEQEHRHDLAMIVIER